MKQLIGLVKDKRQRNQFAGRSSLLPKETSQMEEQSQYMPDEDQILIYAQFLGIKLPEEEHLLYIAKEGLMADLPQGWVDEEVENGQIIYINVRTGQRTMQHPCDAYYQDLVIKERRKTMRKSTQSNSYNPKNAVRNSNIGDPRQNITNNYGPMHQKQPIFALETKPTDPLLQLHQQKEQRKLEERKKMEFDSKKREILSLYQRKKEDLNSQLKGKEERMRKHYQEEEKNRRSNLEKKTSEEELEEENRLRRELQKYQKEEKKIKQRQYTARLQLEKQNMERRMKQKKQEIKMEMEANLRRAKKEIEQEYNRKLQEMQRQEKELAQEGLEETHLLDEEIQKLKQEIVQKKMAAHSEEIRQETEKQRELYQAQVSKLLREHDARVAKLQKEPPRNTINFEQLTKEAEMEEKEELKMVEYELKVLQQMKKVQTEAKIQQLKAELNEVHKQAQHKVTKEFKRLLEEFENQQKEVYEAKLWEAQKKSKEEYLRQVKDLSEKYSREEEIVRMENPREPMSTGKEQLLQLESAIQSMDWEEKAQRKELERVRSQIQAAREHDEDWSQKLSKKLNSNQMKLYQMIQGQITNRIRS